MERMPAASLGWLARPSIHRAFAGDPIKPNFTTVFNVLDSMGFRLRVTVRRGAGAARLKSVDCHEPER
jgi:DNA-binding phage protein